MTPFAPRSPVSKRRSDGRAETRTPSPGPAPHLTHMPIHLPSRQASRAGGPRSHVQLLCTVRRPRLPTVLPHSLDSGRELEGGGLPCCPGAQPRICRTREPAHASPRSVETASPGPAERRLHARDAQTGARARRCPCQGHTHAGSTYAGVCTATHMHVCRGSCGHSPRACPEEPPRPRAQGVRGTQPR